MNIRTAFKRALQIMYDRGEFDKIIEFDEVSFAERRKAKHDKKLVAGILSHFNNDISKISYIAVLHDLKSAQVLKDAICIMADIEEETEA